MKTTTQPKTDTDQAINQEQDAASLDTGDLGTGRQDARPSVEKAAGASPVEDSTTPSIADTISRAAAQMGLTPDDNMLTDDVGGESADTSLKAKARNKASARKISKRGTDANLDSSGQPTSLISTGAAATEAAEAAETKQGTDTFDALGVDVSPISTTTKAVHEDMLRSVGGRGRAMTPFIVATSLSALWLIAAGLFYALSESTLAAPATTFELAAAITATCMPLVLFWAIALAFQRTDPTLDHRLAIARNLDRAMAPVEVAEARLSELGKAIKREIVNLDAVAELASDRMAHIEQRFSDQTSRLFSASAEAEQSAGIIVNNLSQERDKFNTLSETMMKRFSALERTLGVMETRLKATAEDIEATLSTARTTSQTSAEILQNTSNTVEQQVTHTLSELDIRQHDISKLLETLHTKTQLASQDLDSQILTVESRFNDFEDRAKLFQTHMESQAQRITHLSQETEAQSRAMESRLTGTLNSIEGQAQSALKTTETVGNLANENAAQALSILQSGLSVFDSSLTEAMASFAERQAVQERINTEIAAGLTEATGLHTRSLEDAAEAHTRSLLAASEQHAYNLQTATTHHTNTLSTAQADMAAALDATLQSISDTLAASNSKLIGSIERAGNNTYEHIAAAQQMFDKAQATFTGNMSSLSKEAQFVESSLTQLAAALEARASDMAELSSASQEQLAVQNESANQILESTRASLSEIETHFTLFRNHYAESQNQLAETSSNMVQRLDQINSGLAAQSKEIQTQARQAADAVFDSSRQWKDAYDILLSGDIDFKERLESTVDALKELASTFAGERTAIEEKTSQMIAGLTQASSAMGREVQRFEATSQNVAHAMAESSHAMRTATNEAEDIIDTTARAVQDRLTSELDTLNTQAQAKLGALTREIETRLQSALDSYHHSIERAGYEGSELAARLSSESEKLISDADKFRQAVEAINAKLAKSNKDDFIRTSTLITESLQSSAIDIHKALTHDIPDTVWQEYTDGDRSVFMRRTLKMVDRRTRRDISRKFDEDPEFREAASRYMTDFEALMERVMHNDRGSALSATIVSSHMGKLYLLLAQTLKKLS